MEGPGNEITDASSTASTNPRPGSTATEDTTTSTTSTSTSEATVGTSSGVEDLALEPCECNFLCPLCARPGCIDFDQWCTEQFECNIREQDCPAGEKCAPWANDGGAAWNATRCVPIDAEPAQIGEPCTVEGHAATGIDSCDVAQLCFDVDDRNAGTCVGFCDGLREDLLCPAGLSCAVTNDGVLALCRPTCAPLQPTCADGQGCSPTVAGAFVCLPAPSEALVSPYTCYESGGCEPGSICRAPGTVPDCANEGGCCTPYCDLGQPSCSMGSVCIPFFEQGTAPAGLEDVGVCGLPG